MITLKAFTADEQLPTLAAILAQYPSAQIVKYSPQKRCTIRIIREGRAVYAKVYPTKFRRRERGRSIDEMSREFWNLTRLGRLNFDVPRPLGWDDETVTIWSEELKGTAAVGELATHQSEKIAFRIGKAVALIALSGIVPARIFGYAEQMADAVEFAELISQKFPELSRLVRSILCSLENARLPERKLAPIHGDMHIDQWLTDRNDLGLLDFEDFSLGHPERDLAFFMVQLETEYGTKIDHDSLNNQFLSGYRSEGLRPNVRLVNIYSAHKWFSKASKSVSSVEAQNLLFRAMNCLNESGNNTR